MAKISSQTVSMAAVAAVLLSGVGLRIDSASADDNCATAPGAAPPEGQHWYYRTDREKQRKCWYLHATTLLPNRAAAESPAAPPESAPPVATPQTTNAASAAQPAAGPANPPSDADPQPAPHVTVLTVKTVTAPFGSTASASQPATPEQSGEPPMPQITPGNTDMPVNAETAPGADPVTVPVAPVTADNALPPAQTVAADAGRTQPAQLFFLLALALGITAALIAVVGKMAGQTRSPRLLLHPDDAWRSYRAARRQADAAVIDEEDAPFLAPQEPYWPVDLDAQEWIERSPPAQADLPVARRQDGEPGRAERVVPTQKDIELALRILRQVRQSLART